MKSFQVPQNYIFSDLLILFSHLFFIFVFYLCWRVDCCGLLFPPFYIFTFYFKVMSNTVHSIEIRNLWKKYDFFWENLNPDVNILIGINGSGKTTLFNIIDSIMMADVKRLRIYGTLIIGILWLFKICKDNGQSRKSLILWEKS